MDKIRVLFVCIHNSARSQMAEAFLNKIAADRFYAESAGIKPGALNPLEVESMEETGIDISGNRIKSVFDMHKEGRSFDYVITVCDESSAATCPTFPGAVKRIHWSFRDPSTLEGSDEEKLVKIREIRDEIKNRIEEWSREAGSQVCSDFY